MPTLLFIHGINGHGQRDAWLAAIGDGLAAAMRPPIDDAVSICAPSYTWLLHGADEAHPAPVQTYRKPDILEYRKAHWAYARRAVQIAHFVDQWPAASKSRLPPIPEHFVDPSLKLVLQGVNRYVTDEGRRNRILTLFLDELGSRDELIIVAHSLGSVIALDLLYVLADRVRVQLLLTLGSPLNYPSLSKHLRRVTREFPFERVEAWVNVVAPNDVVTRGEGLAQRYPEAVDAFVGIGGFFPHGAAGYLSQAVVGEVLGEAIHGSKSTDLVRATLMPEVPPKKEQLGLLLRLHYAVRLENAIDDPERRERFRAARSIIIDEVKQLLTLQAEAAANWGGGGRPTIPTILRELDGELSQRLRSRFDPLEAVTLLLLLAMARPLDPFDIQVDDDEVENALRNVLLDLVLPSEWAKFVTEAIQDAKSAHRDRRNPLVKIAAGTAIAAGVVAVVGAPFLLLPFAAAGTAGAAALTSGLAGVGALVNGGMAAGIATISALAAGGGITAASGAIVFAANSSPEPMAPLTLEASSRIISESSVEELTATVVQIQALAKLRESVAVADPRHPEWLLLVRIQSDVAESLEAIRALSDKNSSRVEQWQQKQQAITRGLDWMRERSLGPPQREPGTNELTEPV